MKTDYVDWFTAYGKARTQGQLQRPGDVQRYIDFLWPVSLDYASPLNPVFLNECRDLESMNRHPIWLARDGLIPLIWFFWRNPEPQGFHGKLLVHESLGTFVPPAWRSNTGTYTIESRISARKSAPKRFILVGLIMDVFCSSDYLEEYLAKIVRRIGRRALSQHEILAFMPGRYDAWGGEHKHDYHIRFSMNLARHIGTQVRSLTWNQLESFPSFEDYGVIELNEGLLCSDNYLLHTVLGRGARLMGVENHSRGTKGTLKPNETQITLSPYHGMKVKDRIEAPFFRKNAPGTLKSHLDDLERFETAMRSEANRAYPWPNWMVTWTQSAAKTSQT